jgi:quercetin dioxygenase-like cupin family protein
MTVTPTRSQSMRRTETPNAAMTTIASPTQGPTDQLSMWRVHMHAGQQGPRHVFDSEQVWFVLEGEIEVAVNDSRSRLGSGDGIVLEAATERQVIALLDTDMIVCGRGDAVASVPGETESRGTPPWVS